MITLLSNLGNRGGYLAMIQAALYCRNPAIPIIDLNHSTSNLWEAAYLYYSTHTHFPPDTVHLAILNPIGANGTICVTVPGVGHFVGPDNGCFSYIMNIYSDYTVRKIIFPEGDYIYPTYVRDDLAPLVANLSLTQNSTTFGSLIDRAGLVIFDGLWADRFEFQQRGKRHLEINGQIIYVDPLTSNHITNIPQYFFEGFTEEQLETCWIMVGDFVSGTHKVTGIRKTPPQKKVPEYATFGNSGMLEFFPPYSFGNKVRVKIEQPISDSE